jgi:hypothetical protein
MNTTKKGMVPVLLCQEEVPQVLESRLVWPNAVLFAVIIDKKNGSGEK